MPKIAYKEMVKGFSDKSLALIDKANEIIEDFEAQGYDLTLRQLYYQLVARDIIPNTPQSYDSLGSLINDARLMGYVDWDSITDRTRNLRRNSHWESPKDIMNSAAVGFAIDKWRSQTHRPEVWVEKDALVGVISSICQPLDVPYFACRGYTSQSEMWAASQRILDHIREGFQPVIFHLGDHDPSGIDMSRDIQDRLDMFVNFHLEEEYLSPSWYDGWIPFERLALNSDQIRQYNPPPNPAKMSDVRARKYVEKYGYSSWELDALSPTVISGIVREAVESVRDNEKWEAAVAQEDEHKERLKKAARLWGTLSVVLDSM